MKTIKKISVLFVATVFSSFALSCSSSDDGGGPGDAAEGTITASVNGSTVTTLEMTTAATVSSGVLHFQGTAGSTTSKSFSINVNGFEGVGTYDVGGGSTGLGAANAAYIEIVVDPSNPMNFEETIWSAPYDGGDKVGEIQVSEYVEGDYVKGTFHFTAMNPDDNSTKNITNGSFFIYF